MNVLLDVAIGLATVFLFFAIIVSAVNEWLAHLTARRGAFLQLGVQRLVGDDAVFRRVLHHPLISGLAQSRAGSGKPPSYIDPPTFALALADVLAARAGTPRDQALTVHVLRQALQSPQMAGSAAALTLRPIVDKVQQAGGDLQSLLKELEDWFASGMDRVSGWYKARTRVHLFVIGFVLAALANVDAIEIAARLNQSQALRQSWAALGSEIAKSGEIGGVKVSELSNRAPSADELKAVQRSLNEVVERARTNQGAQLPIGWACLGQVMQAAGERADVPTTQMRGCWAEAKATLSQAGPAGAAMKILGWLLTAMAGTAGAGYWFNALVKAVNLRSSGPKPAAPAAKPAAS